MGPDVNANRGYREWRNAWMLSVFTLLVLFFTLPACAQDLGTPEVHIKPRTQQPANSGLLASLNAHSPLFKRDVDVVLVPVTVTDPYDRVVTGLEKKNFAVFENKQKEHIQSFWSDDAPISLGIIFDMSGSMADKIGKAKEAVVQFLQSANPQDEFFMIGFSNDPSLISGFTTNISDIQNKLMYMQAKGRTSLLDAIYLGVDIMNKAHHRRKALLIISDGGDNNSRYTEGEIKDLVEEKDIQIFGIGLYDLTPGTEEEIEGPQLLSTITEATGGRTFNLDDIDDLPDVATKIGIELRNEYMLGYLPVKKAKDGKWHKIKVKLMPPKGLPPLTVYAKNGYYAPQQ